MAVKKTARSAPAPAKKLTKKKSGAAQKVVAMKAKVVRAHPLVKGGFVAPRALYRANPLERIELARQGLPASFVQQAAKLLHMSQDQLNQTLNIPRSTIDRRTRGGAPLTQAQSERLMGVIMLVGQVEEIMADAGDDTADFDAGAWVSGWIVEPLPALGNRSAGELMDTAEGQQLVSRLLAQSVAGAYV